MTIREAITQGNSRLKAAGIETSSLDASLLLAHILNTSRTTLAANGIEPLPDYTLPAYRGLIERRLNGECVAYITGEKRIL